MTAHRAGYGSGTYKTCFHNECASFGSACERACL
jgi:hypothetical protein